MASITIVLEIFRKCFESHQSHLCSGAVPATSTYALTNVTLKYASLLAKHGWKNACREIPELKLGLNKIGDALTHPGVSRSFPDLPYKEADSLLQ